MEIEFIRLGLADASFLFLLIYLLSITRIFSAAKLKFDLLLFEHVSLFDLFGLDFLQWIQTHNYRNVNSAVLSICNHESSILLEINDPSNDIKFLILFYVKNF